VVLNFFNGYHEAFDSGQSGRKAYLDFNKDNCTNNFIDVSYSPSILS
jgi:hypothetical protein